MSSQSPRSADSAAPGRSLSSRLLISVSLLLIVFFGLTIAALDLVFRDLTDRNIRGWLDAQLIALIAASDMDNSGKVAPARALAEPRFAQPGSGLYAAIRDSSGRLLWRSQSSIGTRIGFGAPPATGQRNQQRLQLTDGSEVMALSAGLNWELQPGVARDLVFSVATDLASYHAQLQRFRGQMFGWFLGLMVLLLVALAILLRRMLAPLRRIEREIREVESGERAQLSVSLPRELVGVASNTNALLASERQRVERYRNTLGNLAHSLKTPLAVVRTALGENAATADRSATINHQVDRMDAIIQHQLKRAAASGAAVMGQSAVEVAPVLVELRAALTKVYAHKDLAIEIQAQEGVHFAGDRGDLFELLGNLLDNACKWCRSCIRVTVARKLPAGVRPQIELMVEDDGRGIAPVDRQRILERGARADEQMPGQGLGLAMVREIVDLYGGSLQIDDSVLGGTRIEIILPGRFAN